MTLLIPILIKLVNLDRDKLGAVLSQSRYIRILVATGHEATPSLCFVARETKESEPEVCSHWARGRYVGHIALAQPQLGA